MAIEAKRWTTNRVLVIAGVLALAGIGVYLLLKLIQADEPPIRVRKGSIELQTCNNSAWQDDGNDWFPGGIGQNRLFVHFTSDSTTEHQECQNGVLEGVGVNIRYSNGHVVRIRAAGAKTKIVRGDVSKHPSKNDVLVYTAQPNDTYFIDEIQVTGGPGGTKRCEFTSPTALTHALICSSPTPGGCPCNLP